MIEFHDFDPANPYSIENERHTISGNMITLDHLPQMGSVVIEGFTEVTTVPSAGEYRVDYGYNNNYRTSMQAIYFAAGYDGMEIAVSYNGIGTLLRAKHINELRRFMETGASELAARMLVNFKESMAEILETHCQHLALAINEVARAIASGSGGWGGGTAYGVEIASDEEADALLDEFFPGDVEPSAAYSPIASNQEADAMLDQYFYTPGVEPDPENAQDSTGIEDVATDDEFNSMLDDVFPSN